MLCKSTMWSRCPTPGRRAPSNSPRRSASTSRTTPETCRPPTVPPTSKRVTATPQPGCRRASPSAAPMWPDRSTSRPNTSCGSRRQRRTPSHGFSVRAAPQCLPSPRSPKPKPPRPFQERRHRHRFARPTHLPRRLPTRRLLSRCTPRRQWLIRRQSRMRTVPQCALRVPLRFTRGNPGTAASLIATVTEWAARRNRLLPAPTGATPMSAQQIRLSRFSRVRSGWSAATVVATPGR